MQDARMRNATENTRKCGIPDNSRCQYTAALAFYIRDYVNHSNFSDATDMNGDYLLNSYRRGQLKNDQKETPSHVSASVYLVPKLTQNDNKLSVSFGVGNFRKCSW